MANFRALTLAGLLLAVAFSGVNAQTEAQFATLADAATAANLTTLATLAQGTVLESALGSTEFQGIVLAPTNAAFERLNASLNGSLASLPQSLVEQVLQYHVIASNTSFPELNTSSRSVADTLLSGQYPASELTSTLSFVPALPDVWVGGIASQGTLVNISANVTAAQARVYIIDSVLLPPLADFLGTAFPLTVAGAAANASVLSTLVTLVTADTEIATVLSDPTAAYTIFAPTDAAFLEYLSSAGLSANDLASLIGGPEVNRILKNHVLNYYPVLSTDIPDNTTLTVPTLSANATDVLTITKNGSTVTVAGAGNTAAATVVSADVLAGVSVIHVIDKLLLPAQ